HVGKNLAISLQEFITLSFLYRKRTIKRILFAFIFQTSALPVQSRLVNHSSAPERFARIKTRRRAALGHGRKLTVRFL
ncbi:MAG TPA: hypothetical protein VNI84_00590, partial [Pyrinomonadaceae bacterium]|nr:hypothetical protein [Pyrinomonadaceae bacterium]